MLSSFLDRVRTIDQTGQLDGHQIGEIRLWRATLQLFDDVQKSDIDWDTISGETQGISQHVLMQHAQTDWIRDFNARLESFSALSDDEQIARNTEFGTEFQNMLDLGVQRLGIERKPWEGRLAEANLL